MRLSTLSGLMGMASLYPLPRQLVLALTEHGWWGVGWCVGLFCIFVVLTNYLYKHENICKRADGKGGATRPNAKDGSR